MFGVCVVCVSASEKHTALIGLTLLGWQTIGVFWSVLRPENTPQIPIDAKFSLILLVFDMNEAISTHLKMYICFMI